MKLGKVIDLNKCFYDKDHWTHPDLKEGQLYIVHVKGLGDSWHIVTGTFKFGKMEFYQEDPVCWNFTISCSDFGVHLGYDKLDNPKDEWKHIQEVIV